jgi:hypothetical protein
MGLVSLPRSAMDILRVRLQLVPGVYSSRDCIPPIYPESQYQAATNCFLSGKKACLPGMPSQSVDAFTNVLHSSVFGLRSSVSGLPSSGYDFSSCPEFTTQGIASLQSILKANTRLQQTVFYPVKKLACQRCHPNPLMHSQTFCILLSSVFGLRSPVFRLPSPVFRLPSPISRLPSPVSGLRSPVSSPLTPHPSPLTPHQKRGTKPSQARPPQWE